MKPRRRRTVALDETKLKDAGKQFYIWLAIDVKTKDLLAIRTSLQRSILDAELFFQRVLKMCPNRPLILADRAPDTPCDARPRPEVETTDPQHAECYRALVPNTEGEDEALLQQLPDEKRSQGGRALPRPLRPMVQLAQNTSDPGRAAMP